MKMEKNNPSIYLFEVILDYTVFILKQRVFL